MEETILPVLVRTVKQSISRHDVIPIASCLVVLEVVARVFQVELVALLVDSSCSNRLLFNHLDLRSCLLLLPRLLLLRLVALLVSARVSPTKFLVEEREDVWTGNLN